MAWVGNLYFTLRCTQLGSDWHPALICKKGRICIHPDSPREAWRDPTPSRIPNKENRWVRCAWVGGRQAGGPEPAGERARGPEGETKSSSNLVLRDSGSQPGAARSQKLPQRRRCAGLIVWTETLRPREEKRPAGAHAAGRCGRGSGANTAVSNPNLRSHRWRKARETRGRSVLCRPRPLR